MPPSAKKYLFTKEHISEWLNYDAISGIFTWKKQIACSIKPGMIAGCINQSGYINIIFGGRCFKAHRLAFFLKNGTWPRIIDHINGIKTDNKWSNLREVDNECQNQQNRKCHRNGILWGTFFHKKTGRYCSRVNINGKTVSLGYHATREEAHNISVRFAKANGIKMIKIKRETN
jgi:hypothetical protein